MLAKDLFNLFQIEMRIIPRFEFIFMPEPQMRNIQAITGSPKP